MFAIAESIEMLLEDMVVAIAKHRRLDPNEIKLWGWNKLLRVYRQIGKSIWDEYISGITQTEIAAMRAFQSAMTGKRPKDLPQYPAEEDNFSEKKKKFMTPWMARYHKANNIPIPEGYEILEEE